MLRTFQFCLSLRTFLCPANIQGLPFIVLVVHLSHRLVMNISFVFYFSNGMHSD